MSKQHGGARTGAGRKSKSLMAKLENNSGHRPIKYIPMETLSEINGEDIPEPSEWLADKTKNSQRESMAQKIYEDTWLWLKERKCDHLVTKEQIEQYASSVARYVQCEEGISAFGLLAKHATTNMPIPSPYVAMSEKFLRRANGLWAGIYQIVKENCSVPFGTTEEDDIMLKLLRGKDNQ